MDAQNWFVYNNGPVCYQNGLFCGKILENSKSMLYNMFFWLKNAKICFKT